MLDSDLFFIIDLCLDGFFNLSEFFFSRSVKFFFVFLNLPEVFLDFLDFLSQKLHFLLAKKLVAIELVGKMVELFVEGVATIVLLAVNFMLNLLPAFVEQL